MHSDESRNPQAFVLIGRIHAIEGRYVKAREAFETAIDLDAQSDSAWHFLGALAVLEKDYDRAWNATDKHLI